MLPERVPVEDTVVVLEFVTTKTLGDTVGDTLKSADAGVGALCVGLTVVETFCVSVTSCVDDTEAEPEKVGDDDVLGVDVVEREGAGDVKIVGDGVVLADVHTETLLVVDCV